MTVEADAPGMSLGVGFYPTRRLLRGEMMLSSMPAAQGSIAVIGQFKDQRVHVWVETRRDAFIVGLTSFLLLPCISSRLFFGVGLAAWPPSQRQAWSWSLSSTHNSWEGYCTVLYYTVFTKVQHSQDDKLLSNRTKMHSSSDGTAHGILANYLDYSLYSYRYRYRYRYSIAILYETVDGQATSVIPRHAPHILGGDIDSRYCNSTKNLGADGLTLYKVVMKCALCILSRFL